MRLPPRATGRRPASPLRRRHGHPTPRARASSGACPSGSTSSGPTSWRSIARLYAEAGADIVQTNTFGASPLKLSSLGLTVGPRRSTARRCAPRVPACRDPPWSPPPSAPRADCSSHTATPIQKPYSRRSKRQLSLPCRRGRDLIVIETMTDLAEALLALRAARGD